MATDATTYTLLRDLVHDVQTQEPKARQKANTVTSVIGTALTAIATVTTFLLQSGLALPEGAAIVVAVLGMVATDFAVSQTKNGMTESTADKLDLELAKRIDLNHDHAADDAELETSRSTDMQQLLAEAKRLAAAAD